MLMIIREKAEEAILKQVAKDFDGYVKVVVDIRRRILTAGGMKHVDGEQMLLEDGSQQCDLCGGGIDLETDEIDYDSMTNLRPGMIMQVAKSLINGDTAGNGCDCSEFIESRGMNMATKDLVLNIAVNLGRLARWASEGKRRRLDQFIFDTDVYLAELDRAPMSLRFARTLALFKERFAMLKADVQLNDEWAEEALTWANILTHRAKIV